MSGMRETSPPPPLAHTCMTQLQGSREYNRERLGTSQIPVPFPSSLEEVRDAGKGGTFNGPRQGDLSSGLPAARSSCLVVLVHEQREQETKL